MTQQRHDFKPMKLRVQPMARQYVDADYVFECIFSISSKSIGKKFAQHAKALLQEAAIYGEEGLQVQMWKEKHKKLEMTKDQYFFVLRTLKNAGLIERKAGRYFVRKKFCEHLMQMSMALNSFLDQLLYEGKKSNRDTK